MAKMLKKQMKSLSVSTEARDKRKINLKDSSDSSSEEEGMQVDQVALSSKTIKKKVFSRAQHMALKKEIRKRRRMGQIGIKGSRRRVEALTQIMDQKVQESAERLANSSLWA